MAKIILYHGTDTNNLEKILKEGCHKATIVL